MHSDSTGPIIQTISAGLAQVADRKTRECLGYVERVGWPRQVIDPVTGVCGVGEVEVWEAREPHEYLVTNHLGFPTFPTRRDAAAYLAFDWDEGTR